MRFFTLKQRLIAFRMAIVFSAMSALAPVGGRAAEPPSVHHVGGCLIETSRANPGIRDALSRTCNRDVPAIFDQLGFDRERLSRRGGAVVVRVLDTPGEMAAHAPPGARLPEWSGAITFPSHNLILLPLRRRDGSPNDTLETTLAHEASHVAFYRVTGGAAIPRWFSEGVAILQSERSSIARKGSIWWASMFNTLPSLDSVAHYPAGAARADIAYAMAADFTAGLIEREGWNGIRYLLRKLETGQPFARAFEDAYGMTVARAEADWRRQIFGSSEWIAVVTGSSALWGAAAILFLLAWTRVRKKKLQRLAEMAREEAPLDQVIATLSHLEDEIEAPVVPDVDGPGALPGAVLAAPRRKGLPMRVNIGGRIHTLH